VDGGEDRIAHLLADLLFAMAREAVTMENFQGVITGAAGMALWCMAHRDIPPGNQGG
jgi:hypothetical protein